MPFEGLGESIYRKGLTEGFAQEMIKRINRGELTEDQAITIVSFSNYGFTESEIETIGNLIRGEEDFSCWYHRANNNIQKQPQ